MKTLLRPAPAVLCSVLLFAAGCSPPGQEPEAELTDQNEMVGPQTCLACHPDQHRTWKRTFHRTMTQEATEGTVQGAFDGQTLTQWGRDVRPVAHQDGFAFEVLDPATGALIDEWPVLRTVGSRRYQQYLTLRPSTGTWERLPYLWHIADRRWVHMNAAFLGTDDQPFDRHWSTWNHNCIYCHNTGPAPGMTNYEELLARQVEGQPVDVERESRYSSNVEELGIACEACHGPGAEHSKLNRNPLRRYRQQWSDAPDPTIVHPARLDHERSSDLCGQCHGQREPLPGRTRTWLESGPTFRPGDRLDEHVRLVQRQSTVPPGSREDLYARRFWLDGTPRLTAYELQGLRASACYRQGELACSSCHTMHGGRPEGQITEEHLGNAACTTCHEEIGGDVARHTQHQPEGSGSLCYSCHMPYAVYGVMEIHRSHQIEIPDAARDSLHGRPNACTNCHLDRSLKWAAEETVRLWGGPGESPPLPEDGRRADGAPWSLVDAVASLHAGDPVQRAVAARLAGAAGAVPEDRAFLVPHLLIALTDEIPGVRRFAYQSLLAIAPQAVAEPYDFLAPARERERQVRRLVAELRAERLIHAPPGSLADARGSLDLESVARLRRVGAARSVDIEIGE